MAKKNSPDTPKNENLNNKPGLQIEGKISKQDDSDHTVSSIFESLENLDFSLESDTEKSKSDFDDIKVEFQYTPEPKQQPSRLPSSLTSNDKSKVVRFGDLNGKKSTRKPDSENSFNLDVVDNDPTSQELGSTSLTHVQNEKNFFVDSKSRKNFEDEKNKKSSLFKSLTEGIFGKQPDPEDDFDDLEEVNPQSVKAVDEVEYAKKQAERLGVEAILSHHDIPKDVELITDEVIEQLVGKDNTIAVLNNGKILVTDPLNPKISNIRIFLRNKRIPATIVPTIKRVIEQLKSANNNFDEDDGEEENEIIQVDSDISRYLENLIADTVRMAATDIHIEAREGTCDIKVRLDGRLMVYDTTTTKRAMSLGYLLFNALARRGAKEFVTHKALDAACDIKIGDQIISLRLATAPEARGFDIIIRILAGVVQKLELDSLGYNPIHLQLMRDTVNLPYGVMLMSGPVGSGKSTSLMSLVSEIPIERKVVSLEDPVEMTIANVTHVPILEHIEGATWDDMLKGLNRWDSNVVIAGEVRDQKTCYSLQKMCTSGRLAMSTIHASNALAIPTRMEDLGADHTMLYDPNFLVCLVNQRLVPAVCKSCKFPLADLEVDPVLKASIDKTFPEGLDGVYTRKVEGCDNCHEGLSGRELLAEVIKVDSIGREFIRERKQHDWGRYLREQGWKDMSQHALQKIKLGLLDPLVVKNIVPIMEDASDESSFDYRHLEELMNE